MSISAVVTGKEHFQSFISNPVNKETISTAVRLFKERCTAYTTGMAATRAYDFETHTFTKEEKGEYAPRFKKTIEFDHTTFRTTELAQSFFPENVDTRESVLAYFESKGEMISSLLSEIEIGAKPKSTPSFEETISESESIEVEKKEETKEASSIKVEEKITAPVKKKRSFFGKLWNSITEVFSGIIKLFKNLFS